MMNTMIRSCFGEMADQQKCVNPFQPNVAFHIKTSHLTCKANQMTGFYLKCNMGCNGLSRIFTQENSRRFLPSQTCIKPKI